MSEAERMAEFWQLLWGDMAYTMAEWEAKGYPYCTMTHADFIQAFNRFEQMPNIWKKRLLDEYSISRAKTEQIINLEKKLASARHELLRLKSLLNTPEVDQFDKAVPLEASHQQLRWGAEHDAGKEPEDWFWLIGYLAGKALAAFKLGNLDKAKHHCISAAAALRNWHAHIRTGKSAMRPGIGEDKQINT